MLLKSLDRLIAVVSFRHQNHVRFAFEQASYAIQNKRMIVCAEHADWT